MIGAIRCCTLDSLPRAAADAGESLHLLVLDRIVLPKSAFLLVSAQHHFVVVSLMLRILALLASEKEASSRHSYKVPRVHPSALSVPRAALLPPPLGCSPV